MMKKFGLLFMIAITACSCAKKVTLDKGNYNYQVVALGSNINGKLLIKSFATGNDYEEIKQNVLKKVIREVLFVGITNGNKENFQKPILTSPQIETEKKDYFSTFYPAMLTTKTYVDIIREFATKKEIKQLQKTQNLALGFEISVDRDKMIEKLISDGIIKK